VTVPEYYTGRNGRVFRLRRRHHSTDEGIRYVLSAVAVGAQEPAAEQGREVKADRLGEQIARGVVVETPEQHFEALWQQLRLDLDSVS
jgi:hypothetical protein